VKRILFVLDSLECNGAANSAVNLLNLINCGEYSVDLLVLNKNDKFYFKQLPKMVNVLENDQLDRLYKPLIQIWLHHLFRCEFGILYYRILRMIYMKKNKKLPLDWVQRWWIKMLKHIKGNYDRYDIAIGYNEIFSSYYVALNIEANKKICWNHSDYGKMQRSVSCDEKIIKEIDYIISVSNSSNETMRKNFKKEFQNKFKVIYNMSYPKNILNQSVKSVENDRYFYRSNIIKILTIGRLVNEKGIDIAVEVCKKLIEKGYDVVWYILGDGPLRNILQQKIKNYQLDNFIILKGLVGNPYPYLRECDIYVQPSRYEAYATTINEAKILCKPIVFTNVDGSSEQIIDGKTGLITECEYSKIYEKIKLLIDNKSLRDKFSNNLKRDTIKTMDGNSEVLKLYQLF
jgi:glycosyltransferase involved in cell wall biosynthesis